MVTVNFVNSILVLKKVNVSKSQFQIVSKLKNMILIDVHLVLMVISFLLMDNVLVKLNVVSNIVLFVVLKVIINIVVYVKINMS